jgi:hypothetical protein
VRGIKDLFAFLKENRLLTGPVFLLPTNRLPGPWRFSGFGRKILQLKDEIIHIHKFIHRLETEPEPRLNIDGDIPESITDFGEAEDSQSTFKKFRG